MNKLASTLVILATLTLAGVAGATDLTATVDGPDPVTCGEVKTVTVSYVRDGTEPGLRGYEVTFEVTGGVLFDLDDVDEGTAFGGFPDVFYDEVDNLDGTYTITSAILGATPGLFLDGDLFSVALTTDSDGLVDFEILSFNLRDPDNVPIPADVTDTSFTVDCTASNAGRPASRPTRRTRRSS